MVHIASVHMFDLYNYDGVLDEESPVAREDAFAYDLSKRKGVEKVQQVIAEGLDGTILCPVGLIGPRDYRPSLMGNFFINLYKRRLPALVKGGFYWSDVRDTAMAVINALEQPCHHNLYLLGGHYAEVRQLASLAAEVTGKDLTRPVLPYGVALMGLPFLKTYSRLTGQPPLYTLESLRVLHSKPAGLNDERARTELAYKNRLLRDTIRDSYDWYKKAGLLS